MGYAFLSEFKTSNNQICGMHRISIVSSLAKQMVKKNKMIFIIFFSLYVSICGFKLHVFQIGSPSKPHKRRCHSDSHSVKDDNDSSYSHKSSSPSSSPPQKKRKCTRNAKITLEPVDVIQIQDSSSSDSSSISSNEDESDDDHDDNSKDTSCFVMAAEKQVIIIKFNSIENCNKYIFSSIFK